MEQSPDFPPFSSSVLQAITKTTWRTLEEIGGKSSCPRTDHYTTEPRRTRINQQKKTNIHFKILHLTYINNIEIFKIPIESIYVLLALLTNNILLESFDKLCNYQYTAFP